MEVTAYALLYNNQQSILATMKSLRSQSIPPVEIFALDDGSTDSGCMLLNDNGFCCLSQPANLGRGAARNRAFLEASCEFVVCCDATNVLPPDFLSRLIHWFDDPKVAAVYGWIQDPIPRGAVSRWRARHLFKINHVMKVKRQAPLITYGTIMRRSAVLSVGNFNPHLRHSEDIELGKRLAEGGFDIIFDPSVPVVCNVRNTLWQTLERFCRWYFGDDYQTSTIVYLQFFIFCIRVMLLDDLKRLDFASSLITLLLPCYRFWRTVKP
jgi:N-acetylglucosaminyltransferase